jgi:hypothetical protein
MVIPHYIYLLLKMPTEKGVLSLRGNVLIAYNCEKEGYATAEALELSPETVPGVPLSFPQSLQISCMCGEESETAPTLRNSSRRHNQSANRCKTYTSRRQFVLDL